MTPELRHLRYFVAVAEHLNFTRAARDLHIAQQSLSQQIIVLERALGARLLDRDGRGARLTEAGRLFLPEARAVLAQADRAAAVVRRAARGEIGQLDIAFLISTANYMLPPVVRAFRDRFPNVELGLVAAGVGVTRLAQSAHSLRRTGVTFVPLVGDQAETVVAWHPRNDKPALRNLLDLVAELAAANDLTQSG